MSGWALFAVGLGAAIGAWCRLGLGVWLNQAHPSVPLGTLVANVIGGLLVGVSVGLIDKMPTLDPVWRMAIVTGFLGGLTTFSTFSIEAVNLLNRGQFGWLLGHSALHLLGAIGAAAIGLRIASA
ncbi:MAG: fluoride efflux transporter CrcB [Burkholderiaceae bacterium]